MIPIRLRLVPILTLGIVGLAGCGGATTGAQTVTVNSRTCVQGYRTAGSAFNLLSKALADAAQFPPLIEQAARAGLEQDTAQIDVIAARERRINAKLKALSGQLNALNASFNPSPGGCK